MQPLLLVVLFLLQSGPAANFCDPAETAKKAESARAAGDLRSAEIFYRQALAAQEREVGMEHPGLVPVLNGLGEVLHQMERDVEAQPVLQKSLAIQERFTPDSHATLGVTLNNLAEVYRSRERFVAAEPLFRRALHELEIGLGDNHVWVARVLNNLGALRAGTGFFEEADKLLRRALALSEAHQRESAEVAGILSNLGATAIGRGKFREAEKYLARAMRIQASRLSPDDPVSVAVALQYASVLRQTGHAAQAEVIEARVRPARP